MKKFEFQMESNSKDLVVLKNDIVKARYKLSIMTQKLMLFLISHITYEERKEGKFLNELNFSLFDIYEFYRKAGWEKSKDLKNRLKESIMEIQKNAIAVQEFLHIKIRQIIRMYSEDLNVTQTANLLQDSGVAIKNYT